MRRNLCLTMMIVLGLAAPVLAQVAAPGRGHGLGRAVPEGSRESQAAPGTRPAVQVTKVTGQVESLPLQPMGGGMVQTAVLKTASGSTTVFLGPAGYVKDQKFPLNVGDTWEVTGHQSAMDQRPGLVAREVKAGGNLLKLRDERGQPLWRGMGR